MGRHEKFRGPKFDYVIVDEVVYMIPPAEKPGPLFFQGDYTSEDLGWVPPTPITRGEKLLLELNGKSVP